MTSSLFGTLEQWYIRKHIKKQDGQGPAVPAKAKPKKPIPGVSFFEKLQKRAEEAQRMPSRRQRTD